MLSINLCGLLFWEYDGELYPDYLNQGNAAQFIRHVAEPYCIGNGLDIGGGPWGFPGARVVDNGTENAMRLDVADGSLDYIFSSHCLEHLTEPSAAIKLWASKLRRGGSLFLYLPHPSMKLWRPGSAWVGDGHKWSPSPATVAEMIVETGCRIIGRNDERDAYWSFWICGSRS